MFRPQTLIFSRKTLYLCEKMCFIYRREYYSAMKKLNLLWMFFFPMTRSGTRLRNLSFSVGNTEGQSDHPVYPFAATVRIHVLRMMPLVSLNLGKQVSFVPVANGKGKKEKRKTLFIVGRRASWGGPARFRGMSVLL